MLQHAGIALILAVAAVTDGVVTVGVGVAVAEHAALGNIRIVHYKPPAGRASSLSYKGCNAFVKGDASIAGSRSGPSGSKQ